MRGPTHALAGATTVGLFVVCDIPHQYPPILLSAVAGFAALIPDLDGSESMIENIRFFGFRILKFPGFIIDKLFTHRGFLHSLMALAFLGFIFLGFFPNLPKEFVWAALFGYASHLITDAMTPMGIPWFYPLDWRASLLPKILTITTGSFMETVFFIGLLALYVIVLASAGYIILPR